MESTNKYVQLEVQINMFTNKYVKDDFFGGEIMGSSTILLQAAQPF